MGTELCGGGARVHISDILETVPPVLVLVQIMGNLNIITRQCHVTIIVSIKGPMTCYFMYSLTLVLVGN